jgi:hypothetical protein
MHFVKTFAVHPSSRFPRSLSSGARLIQEGVALPFTALSAAPTVTLPRLRALTSGKSVSTYGPDQVY